MVQSIDNTQSREVTVLAVKEKSIEMLRSDDPRFNDQHLPLQAKTKKNKDGKQIEPEGNYTERLIDKSARAAAAANFKTKYFTIERV